MDKTSTVRIFVSSLLETIWTAGVGSVVGHLSTKAYSVHGKINRTKRRHKMINRKWLRLFVPVCCMAAIVSSCDGSNSESTDTSSDSMSEPDIIVPEPEVVDDDAVSDNENTGDSVNYSGQWYGVLSLEQGLSASDFDQALLYEVNLLLEPDGFYTGSAQIVAGLTTSSVNTTVFSVRAETVGDLLEIVPVTETGRAEQLTRNSDSQTCKALLQVSQTGNVLEGTWSSDRGSCGAGVIALRRVPEPRQNWYENLPGPQLLRSPGCTARSVRQHLLHDTVPLPQLAPAQ